MADLETISETTDKNGLPLKLSAPKEGYVVVKANVSGLQLPENSFYCWLLPGIIRGMWFTLEEADKPLPYKTVKDEVYAVKSEWLNL